MWAFFISVSNTVQVVVKVQDQATSPLKGITGALSGMASVAGGIVAADFLGRIAGGLTQVATVGFDFNRSIENATARLNAFTKDAAVSQDILEDLRLEAAKTPFAFEDMANAGTNLLPVANQLNMDLMDLVRTAEVLAASNPAEGLEGAAFALKEAASGDFASIIERFNLSRSAINALKDEGVPAMEIVAQVMRDMGLDMDLVSNMANTFDGRMSTLKDNFTNLAGTFTQPIFDMFSEGLGSALGVIDGSMPSWEALAKKAGEDTATWIKEQADVWLPRLQEAWNTTATVANDLTEDALWLKQTVQDIGTTWEQAWNGEWVDSSVIMPIHRLTGTLALDLKPAFDGATAAAGWFMERGEETGELIGGTLVPFVESLVNVFNALFNSNNEVNDAMQAGNLLLLTFKKSVEGFLGNVAAGWVKFFEDAAFFIDVVASKIRLATEALNNFAMAIQTVGGAVPFIDAAVGAAGDAVNVGPGPSTQQQGGLVPKDNTTTGATTTGGAGGRGQVTVGAPVAAGAGVIPAGANVFYMTINNALDIEEVAYRVAEIIQSRRSNS